MVHLESAGKICFRASSAVILLCHWCIQSFAHHRRNQTIQQDANVSQYLRTTKFTFWGFPILDVVTFVTDKLSQVRYRTHCFHTLTNTGRRSYDNDTSRHVTAQACAHRVGVLLTIYSDYTTKGQCAFFTHFRNCPQAFGCYVESITSDADLTGVGLFNCLCCRFLQYLLLGDIQFGH